MCGDDDSVQYSKLMLVNYKSLLNGVFQIPPPPRSISVVTHTHTHTHTHTNTNSDHNIQKHANSISEYLQ